MVQIEMTCLRSRFEIDPRTVRVGMLRSPSQGCRCASTPLVAGVCVERSKGYLEESQQEGNNTQYQQKNLRRDLP
jgi:hypothetical protein